MLYHIAYITISTRKTAIKYMKSRRLLPGKTTINIWLKP